MKIQRDTGLIFKILGSLYLLIGIASAIIAPLEIYVYYLFSEGGRFHYEGFKIGSLMYANISIQIIAYYIIALIFIPLGYGHLKSSYWIRPVSIALIRLWIIIGLPLLLFFNFVLLTSKEPGIPILIISLAFTLILYTLLPYILLKFYKSEAVLKQVYINKSINSAFRRIPYQLLTNIFLFIFYIIVLHTLFLFRGIFPVFGIWFSNLTGFLLITFSNLILIKLIYGTIKRFRWAWTISIISFIVFMLSAIISLINIELSELINLVDLPAFEANRISKSPFTGLHISIITAIPFILSIFTIFRSKKYYLGSNSN